MSPTERSHFHVVKAVVPHRNRKPLLGPKQALWHGELLTSVQWKTHLRVRYPQPLARQAWGRYPAVSMKTVYSALAAWHHAGFTVWVVSHSPSPLPR